MEDSKFTNQEKEMEIFTKLQQKLNKVKRYRENNQKRLIMLKEDMRKVRDHMEDVNRQQNLATHKIITGRKKT